ncbi:hypothetical protein QNK12_29820 [Neobacillus cucumis]|nr:hypothetical protein QNK12_29820 [Neobacillus cucumis]
MAKVVFSLIKEKIQGHYIEVLQNKGEILLTQIDVNQLNQAKANVTLTQELLTKAIEKANSDPILAQEAIKQASNEISSALTAVTQVQKTSQTESTEF